jgi:hypothetical protein
MFINKIIQTIIAKYLKKRKFDKIPKCIIVNYGKN